MHYINKNYVLQPIYNDENECINDMLSITSWSLEEMRFYLEGY